MFEIAGAASGGESAAPRTISGRIDRCSGHVLSGQHGHEWTQVIPLEARRRLGMGRVNLLAIQPDSVAYFARQRP